MLQYFRAATLGLLAIGFCALGQRAAADTTNQLFVERSYHDLLGRVPDATGLTTYANALDSNTLSTTQVADSITGGAEFHGVEARQEYQALLHRDADPFGFNTWVNALGAGATVEQLQANLAGSSEYYTNRAGGTDSGFITALYSDLLGRSASPLERSFGIAALGSGESRTDYASGILSAMEYDQHLASGYFPRFLHRPADPTGVSFYSGELQHGTRDEQVISQIVGTTEYYNLPLLPGDTNFDQTVNFTDLLTLAQSYGQKGAHWFNGDFNNDGTVGFADLLLLAQNYGRNVGTAVSAGSSLAQVPEPAVLPALVLVLAPMRRKRRS